MLGLESSREPVFGTVAWPAAGGAGAFFFLCSDCTRASQGGSLGLWVPLDKLDIETQTRREGVTRGRTTGYVQQAAQTDDVSETDGMQQWTEKGMFNRSVTFQETEIAHEVSEESGASGSHL